MLKPSAVVPDGLGPGGTFDKLKGFINHGMCFVGKNTEFNLLNYGVLQQFGVSKDPVARCCLVQQRYRAQLARVMSVGDKLALTYAANCPPCGVKLALRPRLCNQPKVCPWCFIRRRMVPAYRAMLSVPSDMRGRSKVIAWKRTLPYSAESLDLFSKNYGPHQRVGASVTVQAILPYVDNGLKLRHVGVQVVSVDCRHEVLFRKLRLDFHVEPKVSALGAHRAVVYAFRLPWKNFFEQDQTSNFVKVMEDFRKRRLIRINQFKGESRGYSQPAVSEEFGEPV